MSDSWVPGGLPHGLKYSSYVINAPQYLAHLHRSLEALGVPFVRARLTRLDEAFRIPGIGPVKLVVNATGLGARSLVGVQDDQVLGARGQTVLVRAPGVKRCIVRTEGFNAVPKPGESESRRLSGELTSSPAAPGVHHPATRDRPRCLRWRVPET